MAVSIACPHVANVTVRMHVEDAAKAVITRWRPRSEDWRLSLFKSQSGAGWDLALSGPNFRRVLPLQSVSSDALPDAVAACIDSAFTTGIDAGHGSAQSDLRSGDSHAHRANPAQGQRQQAPQLLLRPK